MNKNKLLLIIRKDIEELSEITRDIDESENPALSEIEFILSKSRTISREFELLKELVSITREKSFLPETEKINYLDEDTSSSKDDTPASSMEIIPLHSESKLPKEEGMMKTEEKTALDFQMEEVSAPGPEIAKEERYETSHPREEDGQKQAKQEEAQEHQKTFGESFIQGKSVNDMLAESKTFDRRLASFPLASLEAAIGLNDRFLFIRELFGNDTSMFNKTIRQLDQMQSLDEAVSFLSNNFKWKKNDPSLKFAQLIKRRFSE